MRIGMRAAGVLLGALLGTAAAPAASLAGDATLERIDLVPGRASIFPGGAFAFRAIGTYSDGTAQDITKKVTFASDAPAVADFVKKNITVAFAPGAAGITASRNGTVSQPVTLEVSEIAMLEIEPALGGIRLGSLFRWNADAVLANGAGGLDVTSLVDWTSDDEDIVEIGNRKRSKALSRARRLGTTMLHANFAAAEPDVTASWPVTVVDPLSLDSIVVTPATRVLQLGDGGGFRAIGNFDGVLAEITLNVDWLSDNPDVATTKKSGVIKIRGFGSTHIDVRDRETPIESATTGGSAELIVVGAVTALSVEPPLLALAVGEDDDFDAIAAVQGSMSTFSWSGRVVWTSSDPTVASVDGDGDVFCESAGTATITARDPRSGIVDAGEVTCS